MHITINLVINAQIPFAFFTVKPRFPNAIHSERLKAVQKAFRRYPKLFLLIKILVSFFSFKALKQGLAWAQMTIKKYTVSSIRLMQLFIQKKFSIHSSIFLNHFACFK